MTVLAVGGSASTDGEAGFRHVTRGWAGIQASFRSSGGTKQYARAH